jgi:phospholipase C
MTTPSNPPKQPPLRRDFLKLLGSSAMMSALPLSISRAMALPANNRTGSIKDVEHIVVLMQENRSFDHYFGALKGMRGFADPRAVVLPNGKSVWQQPDGANVVMPYRPDVANVGMEFLPDPPHGWGDSHEAWNEGKYDRWVPAKGQSAMAYLTRKDIPYHYALADAFTTCDAYHCSLMGPTDPNRYHLWTGWCGNDGAGGGPVITNAEAGYDWMTFPERLQSAGISWKVYQDVGVGLDALGYWGWTDDAYIGNYGDNSLLYFHQYQNALNATALADNARTGTNITASGTLFDMFKDDVRRGKLPKISYVVAPEAFSEHPNWPANYGAWYISQILDALTANPQVWSKTALFLTYDEAGGYFDHMVPATPPASPAQGKSSVATTNEIFPGDTYHASGPYGLGTRVPMVVISPWSKGGFVNSQVFDHTSIIKFMEARYADEHPSIIEKNITPWRRAVAGDLTSAFDFKKPNDAVVSLPATIAYVPTDKVRHPDDNPQPPVNQVMPKQEPGVRPARAIPYELNARGMLRVVEGNFEIDFSNTGEVAAVFHVRSGNAGDTPRSYTVEPGKQLSDVWQLGASAIYDLTVYGPNGFLRSFKNNARGLRRAQLDVAVHYDVKNMALDLVVMNLSSFTDEINIINQYDGEDFEIKLKTGESFHRKLSLKREYGWYDLKIVVNEDKGFEYRLAGHMETGQVSISDPAMGGVARS